MNPETGVKNSQMFKYFLLKQHDLCTSLTTAQVDKLSLLLPYSKNV